MAGVAAALALMAGSSVAQTRIHLQSQAQAVDFSQAASTRPNRTGTLLPAACTTGETFYKIDEQPGRNLYGCTSTNTWTRLGHAANLEAGAGVAIIGAATVAADDAVIPYYSTGSGVPAHPCRTGQEFYTDTVTGLLYHCRQPDMWQSLEPGGAMPAVQAPVTIAGGAIGCPSCVVNTVAHADPAWLASLDAGKVNSGVLGAERLPAAAVRTDRGNTYAAGQTQVFQASGTSAGMRIAASLPPSSPATGDLMVDSGTNSLQWFDGAAWVSARPGALDGFNPRTTVDLYEEFANGVTSSDRIGALGWLAVIGSGGSLTYPANQGYGVLRLNTGTTAGTSVFVYHGTANTIDVSGNFDLRFRVRQLQVDADTTARIGLNCSATVSALRPAHGIYFENVAGENQWRGVARASDAETRTESLGGNAANTWYNLRLRRVDGSSMGFTLGDGAEQTVSTNIPAAFCILSLAVNNGTAAAQRSLDVDYAWFRVTGLSR
jgi:hypothetical protein